MSTAAAVSSSLFETSAVTPDAWSPVVMVVSEPAGVHCTASVVPVFWLLTVTCAVPAMRAPGGSWGLGGCEEQPETASKVAAATTHCVFTVQNLRRDSAGFSSRKRLVGAGFSSRKRLLLQR